MLRRGLHGRGNGEWFRVWYDEPPDRAEAIRFFNRRIGLGLRPRLDLPGHLEALPLKELLAYLSANPLRSRFSMPTEQ